MKTNPDVSTAAIARGPKMHGSRDITSVSFTVLLLEYFLRIILLDPFLLPFSIQFSLLVAIKDLVPMQGLEF